MKKVIIISAGFFCVLGIIFSYLPLGTIAILPIAVTLGLGFIALKQNQTAKAPKIILGIATLCLLFVLGKTFFVKDEVEVDAKFEQQKTEQKQQAKQELEELESDLE